MRRWSAVRVTLTPVATAIPPERATKLRGAQHFVTCETQRRTIERKGGSGMTRKARIGVIGAGWWAAVNHLPVLKANRDCEIVAVNRLGTEPNSPSCSEI